MMMMMMMMMMMNMCITTSIFDIFKTGPGPSSSNSVKKILPCWKRNTIPLAADLSRTREISIKNR